MSDTDPLLILSPEKSDRMFAVEGLLRRRYTEKWRDPTYRERSPAHTAREQIIELCTRLKDPAKHAVSVLDVGCGTGRFLGDLMDNSFCAWGIDIADNCLDAEAHLDSIFFARSIADAAAAPDKYKRDIVTCIDVMEHIPDEIVDETLKDIASLCEVGAVFGISTGIDTGRLHCAVHDAKWWMLTLAKHFKEVHSEPVPYYHQRQNVENWILLWGKK